MLLARLPGRDDADEVMQEVFVHAWNRLDSLREPAAFGAWIAAIARRRAVDFHRAAPPPSESLEVRPDGSRGPASAAANPLVIAAARQALAAIQDLPEAYRETLVLRLVEGCSGPEIAALTGLTPASVRVNLHRGFALLRARLGVEP